MTGCFTSLLLVAGAVFVLASLLRWFEQTADAVDAGDRRKVMLLVVFPFAVWVYPSRVSAGRPTAVPHHEPVRGFGKAPALPSETKSQATEPAPTPPAQIDQPPPGTPAEFIGLPKIPPKKPKAAIDPEKLAKLKQKMKEQGMLDE